MRGLVLKWDRKQKWQFTHEGTVMPAAEKEWHGDLKILGWSDRSFGCVEKHKPASWRAWSALAGSLAGKVKCR